MPGTAAEPIAAAVDQRDSGTQLTLELVALLPPSPVGEPGRDLGVALHGDHRLAVVVHASRPQPAALGTCVPRQAGDQIMCLLLVHLRPRETTPPSMIVMTADEHSQGRFFGGQETRYLQRQDWCCRLRYRLSRARPYSCPRRRPRRFPAPGDAIGGFPGVVDVLAERVSERRKTAQAGRGSQELQAIGAAGQARGVLVSALTALRHTNRLKALKELRESTQKGIDLGVESPMETCLIELNGLASLGGERQWSGKARPTKTRATTTKL